jgi:hypothetical protein
LGFVLGSKFEGKKCHEWAENNVGSNLCALGIKTNRNVAGVQMLTRLVRNNTNLMGKTIFVCGNLFIF